MKARSRFTVLSAILSLIAARSPAARGDEPSEEYKAGLKRTLEQKRQRRGAARRSPG